MNWCIIIPILVGLISALLGYLLGRHILKESQQGHATEGELLELKNKITNLEGELKTCRESKLGLASDLKLARESASTNLGAAASLTGNADADTEEIQKLKTKINTLEADLSACQESKLGLASDLKLARESASSLTATSDVKLIPFDADAAKTAFGKKIKQDDLKIVEGIGPKIEGLFHSFGIKTWKALSETSIEKCQEVLDSGGERYRIHKPDTWPQQAGLAYEGKWQELKKWQDELDGGKA
ncbi:hypothetical protein [Tenacibaculum agarivorans]|uniref:hypothetical protein n=1 Tax=Tenacibaculum agarivorans TaxID=1908389 RepID=UPI00094BBC33|nr:hypothetical protein [Tenacibaculum agarivorans]